VSVGRCRFDFCFAHRVTIMHL